MLNDMSIVIIGGGFAGASLAWWLTRYGIRDITILEREEMPGIHSSGLNAGMTRGFDEDEKIAHFAWEGAEFIRNPPAGFSETRLIEINGSILLGRKRRFEEGFRPEGSRIISKEEAAKIVPYLKDAKFEAALWSPNDGVVDIHSYLWAYINGAKAKGAKLITNCEVKSIAGMAMTTNCGIFEADIIVNAAGGWAQLVANMAGAEDLGIKPMRRHLYCTPPMPLVNPKWPFVWDMENVYYFRPESGGLLLGPADEEEVEPKPPVVNPKIKEVLAEKLSRFCPSLADVSIAREWCGLRTFTPDRDFVIRWDKRVKNFFWLACLGGSGVNCAAAVGKMAAEMIIMDARLQSG